MSKESLARAANSSDMTVEPGVVHDADRLAAMAGGNVLGGLLLRFRESEQPQWARRIVLILAHRIVRKHRLGRELAERTATMALTEFRQPHCTECGGAKEMILGNLKVTCGACEGTGKQRYTNTTRRARIGTYGTRIDAAMADCHREMADALGAFLLHASWRLE
jgi:hypothetical protein